MSPQDIKLKCQLLTRCTLSERHIRVQKESALAQQESTCHCVIAILYISGSCVTDMWGHGGVNPRMVDKWVIMDAAEEWEMERWYGGDGGWRSLG